MKYLSHWVWISISVLISLTLAFFYLRYAKDIYRSTAKIKILDNKNATFKLSSDNFSMFNNDEVNLVNEMEALKSSKILSSVIDSLNLTTEIHKVGRLNSIELWKDAPFKVVWAKDKDSLDLENISFNITITNKGYTIEDNPKEYLFEATNFESTIPFKIIPNKKVIKKSRGSVFQILLYNKKSVINKLTNAIYVDYAVRQSEMLSISLNGANQDKNNAIINTLIEVFNADGIKDKQLVSKKTIEFVDDRFKYLFNELDSIELAKAIFKKEKGISFVEADAGVLMANNYGSITKVENVETQIALSKLMMSSLISVKSNELLPTNIGIDNNEINDLVSKYNEQILKKKKLLESGAGDSNPMVAQTATMCAELQRNIKTSIIGYSNALNLNKKELQKIGHSDKEKYSDVPFNEKGLRSIERQLSLKESLYILLLQKREEAAINYAITEPTVKVVEFAVASPQPIAPDKKSVLLIALLIGLLLPIIVIYVYYLFDNKINCREDIEEVLPKMPILGEIPFIDKEEKLIQYIDRSVLSEAFRILRTNIKYINPISNKSSVFYVTSTIKGEGKTFVSLNLAITLTTLGKKVILVGADLRNPQIHSKLNFDRFELNGVTNFLYDTTTNIDDLKVKHLLSEDLNLDIIFSGSIPPNPSELLSNGRFEILLNELKKDYDYVIVDTAPTLLVTDTSLITHLADAILYVTRANYTEKKLLKFISKLKSINNIKNIGIVLNNVGSEKGGKYGYSYTYNYGYGYGYDEEDNKKNKSFINKLFKR